MTVDSGDTPVLRVRGAAKAYGAQRALDGVDLDVYAGEVHALLGENGAGKSTLMKIIAGSVPPDAGHMQVHGSTVALGDPQRARGAGVGIVYQELSLIPPLSAGENVLMGRWPKRFGLVNWRGLESAAKAQLDRVGLGGRHHDRVDTMGMAERQLVEIAKALMGEVRVLLFDEPTSALSDPESRRLFDLIADLTGAGVAVLYVSHRLNEVLHLSHRISVLRDGRMRQTIDRAAATEQLLTSLMVGRGPSPTASGPDRIQPPADHEDGADAPARAWPADTETPVGTGPLVGTEAVAGTRPGPSSGARQEFALRARGLARPPRLKPIDLDIRTGEVVAVFGLVGAGRTRLARCLFGLEPATEGRAEVLGRGLALSDPGAAVAAGIGYVGEDRAMGIVPRLSVEHNITLASLNTVSHGRVLTPRRERELSERYIDELNIAVRSPEQTADTLSGGNQQKVVLARWMCSGARLLVLDDPTRGIDVGAKEEVFRLVRHLAEDGVASLYLTSEIKEARALADRLLVMSGGRVVAELEPGAAEEDVMAAAGGLHD